MLSTRNFVRLSYAGRPLDTTTFQFKNSKYCTWVGVCPVIIISAFTPQAESLLVHPINPGLQQRHYINHCSQPCFHEVVYHSTYACDVAELSFGSDIIYQPCQQGRQGGRYYGAIVRPDIV